MYKCNSNHHFFNSDLYKEGNFPTDHRLRVLQVTFSLCSLFGIFKFLWPCSSSVMGGKHQNVQFCEAPNELKTCPLEVFFLPGRASGCHGDVPPLGKDPPSLAESGSQSSQPQPRKLLFAVARRGQVWGAPSHL